MEVLPTCTSPTDPPKYEPITPADFMTGWFAGEYSTMSTLFGAQREAAEELFGDLDAPPVKY